MSPGALLWVAIYLAGLIGSAWRPHDYPTWFLEVAPALVAFGVLALTRRRFPLTTLVYALVLVHCLILMVGGHYTYAKVPLFDHLKALFHLQRNDYDKLGHFAQGFVPALVAREILIRRHVVNGAAWRNFLIVCFCLALSAFYELIEWWTALLSGDGATAFLGTQGDVWDTQSDMLFALIGAVTALLLLSRLHDRQLAGLASVDGQ